MTKEQMLIAAFLALVEKRIWAAFRNRLLQRHDKQMRNHWKERAELISQLAERGIDWRSLLPPRKETQS